MTLPKNNTRRNTALIFMAVSIFLAIHRRDVRQFNPDSKDHHWGKRKLKRDA